MPPKSFLIGGPMDGAFVCVPRIPLIWFLKQEKCGHYDPLILAIPKSWAARYRLDVEKYKFDGYEMMIEEWS